MSRTNIDIADDVIAKAIRVTGARTKRQAVDIALREVVKRESLYRAIRRLQGKAPWEGDVNAWRTSRT